MTVLRIGTRRSQLALWQTHHVRDLLRQSAPDLDVEIVYLTTAGDPRPRPTPAGDRRQGVVHPGTGRGSAPGHH
ncbi:MAG: hypothetical protein KatS3mg051_1644 [Anaerolineae bacterium]|nr:MAG: hypothetical protein KatS3mg051_1644 [Anaerolineae bacterium]